MTATLNGILPKGYEVKKLNRRPFVFLEGPVWDEKSGSLFFCDTFNEKIYEMVATGDFRLVQDNTGNVNGMCLSSEGNLVVCRMATGSLEEIDPETGKRLRVIADTFGGRAFNATNDVIPDGCGGYYFTDPFFTYGPHGQDKDATYHSAADGTVRRVAADSSRPNGLALSPDRRFLYIDDTDNVEVWRYERLGDGALSGGTVFCRLEPPENSAVLPPVQKKGEADGMKVDVEGNLYVTTYTGIQVFDSRGLPLGTIRMPGDETPANCVFGGRDRKTLFICARTSLYSVEMLIPGI